MAMLLTDAEIHALIQEPKDLGLVPPSQLRRQFPGVGRKILLASPSRIVYGMRSVKRLGEGHKRARIDIPREAGGLFLVGFRQSWENQFDFSVILGFVALGSKTPFKLKRYNGKSHEHTNPQEDQKFYDFHIHTATERYQLAGSRKEEHYAEPTDRYSEILGAWECMVEDCNISFPFGQQMDIFR